MLSKKAMLATVLKRDGRASMTDIFTENRTYECGLSFRQEELENYYVDYIEAKDKSHVVIVFEGSQMVEGQATWQRYPWGAQFIHRQGMSVIGVKVKAADWYRGADLHDFFLSAAFKKILCRYDQVYLYGNSMGGYAALAFSGIVEGAKVLALSPQTTLDPDLITWDKRFPHGMEQDWSGRFSDAAETLDKVDVAYVIYDPFFPTDRAHIERLPAENVVCLKTPCLLHDVASALSDMSILKSIFTHFIKGDLETWFPKKMRARKDYAEYSYNVLFLWAMRCYRQKKFEQAERMLQRLGAMYPRRAAPKLLLRGVVERRDIHWGGYRPDEENSTA